MERIGKYRIIEELGRGGFGVVYRAFDAAVGREVAVKVLSAQGDPDLIRRFHAEATTAASLHHKNIVIIHEFGEENGMRYLVMEYLEGTNLQDLIAKSAPITLLEKLRIMSQVAEALQCAHEHGVVHRDVKPANIMRLTDHSVKIMDFGIARLMKAAGRFTQAGLVIGTPQYMAPEQFSTGDSDALCDIWAYGVVLYELLSGGNPFLASDVPSIIYRVTAAEVGSISHFVPDCPRALNGILDRLLARTREQRYQSMEDVVFDLESLMHDLGQIEVGRLQETAEKLIRDQSLEQAQSAVRRILELEPGNMQARKWRESLREHERRRANWEKIENLIQAAGADVAQRNFEAAIAKLNSAAGIDPTSGDVQLRISQLRAEKEKYEHVGRLVSEARAELRQEALTSAFEHANEAAAADPGNHEIQALLASVRRAIEEREARVNRQSVLSKVRGLVLMQAYDEALPPLEKLALSHPQDPEVQERLAEVRRLREAQLAQQKLGHGIRESQDLLRNGRYQAAADLLQHLDATFPGTEQVRSLLSYAREQVEWEQASRKAEQLFAEASAAYAVKEFERALTAVEQAVHLAPGKESMLRLHEDIVAARRQGEEERAQHQATERCRAFLAAENVEPAAATLKDLAAKFPRAPEIPALEAELQRRRQEIREAQEKRQNLNRAESYLETGQLFVATKLLKDLAARYPGEAQIPQLLERASAMETEQRTREAATQAVVELERRIAEQEFGSAIQFGEFAVQKYPFESRVVVLLQKAREEQSFEGLLAKIDDAIRAGNVDQAEKLTRDTPVQAVRDPRWKTRRQTIAIKRHTLNEIQRADEFRKRGDLDSARDVATSLFNIHPDDPAVQSLTQIIERDATAWKEKRRIEQAVREAAELSLRRQYASAIERLESTAVEFPGNTVLQTELDRTRKVRDLDDKNRQYAEGRSEIQALLVKREFEEAAQKIRELLVRFPEDPLLLQDLEVAAGASQVRSRRLQMDTQIAALEKLFHAGDAESVREGAARLLKNGEEPRVRELFTWADESLRKTRTIRRAARGESKRGLYVIAAIAAAAAVGGLLYFLPFRQPTVQHLRVTPAELDFAGQKGKAPPDPQTFAVTGGEPGAEWSVAPSDPWIGAKTGARGVVLVGVESQELDPGDYSGVILITAKSSASAPVEVRVRLRVTPAETGQASTQPRPAPAAESRSSKTSSDKVANSKTPGGKSPEAKGSNRDVAVLPPPSRPGEKGPAPAQPPPHPAAAVPPQPAPQAKTAASQPPEEPIQDCHASDYPGLGEGTIQWSGSLPADAELTLDRRNRIVSGSGAARGDRLPGCDVAVTLLTPGVAVVEPPSQANRFARLTLKNASTAPISAVSIHWKVK